MYQRSLQLLLVLCVSTLLSARVFAQASMPGHWDTRFAAPGVLFPEYGVQPQPGVQAMARMGERIFVGGAFTIPSRCIAAWNEASQAWEQFNGGVWLSGLSEPITTVPFVSGMLADADSLFVWGTFTTAGAKRAYGLAVLHPGTGAWSADSTLHFSLRSVIRFGSTFIVSGSIRRNDTLLSTLATYRNGVWNMHPDFGVGLPTVHSLCVFRNELYVCSDSLPSSMGIVARWDGTRWLPIVDAHSLYRTKYPLQGRVIAGDSLLVFSGNYDSLILHGGAALSSAFVSCYDGLHWHSMVQADTAHTMLSIGAIRTIGTNVWIGGAFNSLNSVLVNGIAHWSLAAGQWNSLGGGISGVDGWLRAIQCIECSDSVVYCGGLFATLGAAQVNNVARFAQGRFSWQALSGAQTLAPNAACSVFRDQGRLLAVGAFNSVNGAIMNHLAYWDGRNWTSTGSGIIGGARPTVVNGRYTPLHDGLRLFARMGSAAVLAGCFDTAANLACSNVVLYTGQELRCLDGGLYYSHKAPTSSTFYPASVSSVLASDSLLFCAGDFVWAGANAVDGLAMYDGLKWHSIATHIQCTDYDHLQWARDSSQRVLLSGTDLRAIDGVVVNGIAEWSAGKWSAATDTASIVSATNMCVASDGSIIIAGNVHSGTHEVVHEIGLWDGQRWTDLAGMQDFVRPVINAMATHGDWLYVAGAFDTLGGVAATNVAACRLSTGRWYALSGGLTTSSLSTRIRNGDGVRSIAILGDSVYFGGNTMYADGNASTYMAAWIPDVTKLEVESMAPQSGPQLRLCPNPADNVVSVRWVFVDQNNAVLECRDLMGCLLIRREIRSADGIPEMHTENWMPGTYFCRIYSGTSSATQVLHIVH